LNELPNELKGPYLGYLILLISVFIMFGLMLAGELQANHPRFVYELIGASKRGVARNIVEGLSIGHLGNVGPVVIWAGVLFLSYFWLGSFGVSLAAVGSALLIPNYLNINTYFSLV
jgi:Na+/H+-translocating membrane pyrophosphatase